VTASRLVALNDVWAMLAECAPGYRKKKTDHHWWVMHGNLKYPGLPLGDHGARKNPEIQAGHVRQMIRQLQIEPCGKKFFGW
jgi:hypothetical protein